MAVIAAPSDVADSIDPELARDLPRRGERPVRPDRVPGRSASGNGRAPTRLLPELGRCFHTLKGAAGSVGLIELAALVHDMEDRLEAAPGRSGRACSTSLHQAPRLSRKRLRRAPPGSDPSAARTRSPCAPGPAPPKSTPADALAAASRHRRRHRPQRLAEDNRRSRRRPSRAGEGPVRVPSERIDELMDLASELITRRGLWAAQAESLKEFAAMARTCRARMLATVDRAPRPSPAPRRAGRRPDGRTASIATPSFPS